MQFGKLCIYMHCTYKIHKYNLEYISQFCTWVVRNTWNTGAELPRHVDPCPCVGSRVVQDSAVPQRCLLRDLQQDMVNSWSSHTATNRVLKATHQSAPWQLLILIYPRILCLALLRDEMEMMMITFLRSNTFFLVKSSEPSSRSAVQYMK